jgi:hypothetical protein
MSRKQKSKNQIKNALVWQHERKNENKQIQNQRACLTPLKCKWKNENRNPTEKKMKRTMKNKKKKEI